MNRDAVKKVHGDLRSLLSTLERDRTARVTDIARAQAQLRLIDDYEVVVDAIARNLEDALKAEADDVR